jgi:predicted secreted protein
MNHSMVFASWLTQWKMAVLSSDSAQDVMANLLDAHASCRSDHSFWIAVTNYLCHQDLVSTPPMFPAGSIPELQQQVRQLKPAAARKLLMHLAAIHQLSPEDSEFWRLAMEAVLRHERALQGPDSRRQSRG